MPGRGSRQKRQQQGDTARELEAAEGGKYFTSDALFFGDDPETGAYVAEGETVVLQDCRPAPA